MHGKSCGCAYRKSKNLFPRGRRWGKYYGHTHYHQKTSSMGEALGQRLQSCSLQSKNLPIERRYCNGYSHTHINQKTSLMAMKDAMGSDSSSPKNFPMEKTVGSYQSQPKTFPTKKAVVPTHRKQKSFCMENALRSDSSQIKCCLRVSQWAMGKGSKHYSFHHKTMYSKYGNTSKGGALQTIQPKRSILETS